MLMVELCGVFPIRLRRTAARLRCRLAVQPARTGSTSGPPRSVRLFCLFYISKIWPHLEAEAETARCSAATSICLKNQHW